MSRTPGISTLLILLCASVSENDPLPAPEDLQISVPVFGCVKLSWRDVTPPWSTAINYYVKIRSPEAHHKTVVKKNSTSFEFVTLHRGLRADVAATWDVNQTDEIMYYVNEKHLIWASTELTPPQGAEGTAAEQLTCKITVNEWEVSFLHCDWLPGKKAPLDTQYYLYYRYTVEGNEMLGECLPYAAKVNEQRQTSCQVRLNYNILDEVGNIFIHINGSSVSQEIRTMQHIYQKDDLEVFPPVRNFALTHEKGLSWEQPLPSYEPNCFSYEVNIWSQDKNKTVTESNLRYWHEDLKVPSSKTHVRVRAKGKITCWSREKYTQWSEIINIERKDSSMLWISMTICFFVASLVLFICCVRFWRSLFPQIPKPKDDLKEAFTTITQHQALMRSNSWDTEEVISYLEVMN